MKKIVVLLLVAFSITGCTIVRIDTDNIDNTINVILSKNNELYNRVGKGYKYYVPRGVNYIDTVEFNDKLYSNGNYYYLYIDAISYFYNKDIDYEEKDDVYYSRKFNLNDKNGYLEIKQVGGKYLINFFYNYARIQTLVNEDEINSVILNSSYILSTVKFNNPVIKLMLDDEFFTNKEENYDIFESKDESNDNFLEYVDDEQTGS
ncbi:MAG: hypothetical protein E7165_01840 [Firmicutes bacterium]|nr:hypothetical protein [Bacillota bacterium]